MKPSGIALLLTRPRPASDRFAALLAARVAPGPNPEAWEAAGGIAEIVFAPVLQIVPLPLPEIPPGAMLAFTSENAVGVAAGLAAGSRRAFCVGDRTADAARAAGFDAVGAGGDAAALADLIAHAHADSDDEIVHLSGVHQRGDLVARLVAAGVPARRVAVYDQVAVPLTTAATQLLAGARPVLVPLFSPRSATILSAAAPQPSAPLLLAALSPAVAEAWSGPLPVMLAVAERPDANALADTVAGILSRASSA